MLRYKMKMPGLLVLAAVLMDPSRSIAEEKKGHWYLSYGKPGEKGERVQLDKKRHDFTNILGQKCWVTQTKYQPNPEGADAEEREVICRIDAKNIVATSLACWSPYKELKRRSFLTARIIGSTKKKERSDSAVVILTCFETPPWTKK